MKQGVVRLHLKFKDGSEIQYITTHNREILESLNYPVKHFIDLDTGKPIPKHLLQYIYDFEAGKMQTEYFNPLDKLAEAGAKYEHTN